jgi:hypothetical protein
VKRRKFATAVALLAALLAVAFAASSVGAATSKSSAKKGRGQASRVLNNAHFAGGASFVNSGIKGSKVYQGKAKTKAFIDHPGVTDRGIPGKLKGKKVGRSGGASAANAAAALAQPRAPSLPISERNYQPAVIGLGSAEQWIYGGYALTPPDNALAEGNGWVVQAVNNLWQVSNNSTFGHVTNVESLESFFLPAIIDSGYNCLSDPKAHYDNRTRRWYMTEVAYDFCPLGFGQPGSAVFIAVSTSSDPVGPYNLYVLDTSFDGQFCDVDGCLADQPLLGMNEHALFISTNSFDWDSCILLGGDCVFNGAQMYIIDSTALAAGFAFPNLFYADLGSFDTPDAPEGCGDPFFGSYPFSAYCWYSVQPATSPNQSYTEEHGGTEWALAAEDWFGSVDNGIVLWAFANTVTISAFFPGPIYISWVEVDGQTYGFPATDTPFFAPWAEQPPSGNTPACDVFYGPFCTPTAISPNDDRMNEVKSVKSVGHAAMVWGGLNTKVLVRDPIGRDHRRVGLAWWSVTPTSFDGFFVNTAAINNQGIVANWNNDLLYPSLGVDTTGQKGAMVYSLTGNTHFPTVATSKFNAFGQVTTITPVASLRGKDVLDDLSGYFGFPARYGDYSAAVGDGHSIYLATEFVPFVDCDADEYIADTTCGGIRNFVTNYGTGIVKVNV